MSRMRLGIYSLGVSGVRGRSSGAAAVSGGVCEDGGAEVVRYQAGHSPMLNWMEGLVGAVVDVAGT
jgi:hypothetical protein